MISHGIKVILRSCVHVKYGHSSFLNETSHKLLES